MAKPWTRWTVLPHGRMRRLEDNLITVAGVLNMPPMGDISRRMTVASLSDRRLVVYSAIALDEAEMEALEAFGKVAFIVVPNPIHRMDARIWKERYPTAKLVAPKGARAKVEEIVAVDATSVDFGDPTVQLVTVDGTREREAAMIVKSEGGTSLVLADIVFNLANRRGIGGWFWKTVGMTGNEPHLPPLVKVRLVDDDRALSAQLERWSKIPDLTRVIVSHGLVIEKDAPEVLGRVAHALAA